MMLVSRNRLGTSGSSAGSVTLGPAHGLGALVPYRCAWDDKDRVPRGSSSLHGHQDTFFPNLVCTCGTVGVRPLREVLGYLNSRISLGPGFELLLLIASHFYDLLLGNCTIPEWGTAKAGFAAAYCRRGAGDMRRLRHSGRMSPNPKLRVWI